MYSLKLPSSIFIETEVLCDQVLLMNSYKADLYWKKAAAAAVVQKAYKETKKKDLARNHNS